MKFHVPVFVRQGCSEAIGRAWFGKGGRNHHTGLLTRMEYRETFYIWPFVREIRIQIEIAGVSFNQFRQIVSCYWEDDLAIQRA